MFFEQFGDGEGDIRRNELLFIDVEIEPILECRNRRSISRWTSDTQTFQCFDQPGFRISARRFGEVLIRFDSNQFDCFPGSQFGKNGVFVTASEYPVKTVENDPFPVRLEDGRLGF